MAFRSIVVLTGAGLSVESGLGTFRDKDGLWSQFPLEEVATPEGFARNPARVHDFYNLRRRLHGDARPNAAHAALARLEQQHDGVLTVTQNIDCLHEAAGTREHAARLRLASGTGRTGSTSASSPRDRNAAATSSRFQAR